MSRTNFRMLNGTISVGSGFIVIKQGWLAGVKINPAAASTQLIIRESIDGVDLTGDILYDQTTTVYLPEFYPMRVGKATGRVSKYIHYTLSGAGATCQIFEAIKYNFV